MAIMAMTTMDVKAEQSVPVDLNSSFTAPSTSFSLQRRPSNEDIRVEEFQDDKKSQHAASKTTGATYVDQTPSKGWFSKVTTWISKVVSYFFG